MYDNKIFRHLPSEALNENSVYILKSYTHRILYNDIPDLVCQGQFQLE